MSGRRLNKSREKDKKKKKRQNRKRRRAAKRAAHEVSEQESNDQYFSAQESNDSEFEEAIDDPLQPEDCCAECGQLARDLLDQRPPVRCHRKYFCDCPSLICELCLRRRIRTNLIRCVFCGRRWRNVQLGQPISQRRLMREHPIEFYLATFSWYLATFIILVLILKFYPYYRRRSDQVRDYILDQTRPHLLSFVTADLLASYLLGLLAALVIYTVYVFIICVINRFLRDYVWPIIYRLYRPFSSRPTYFRIQRDDNVSEDEDLQPQQQLMGWNRFGNWLRLYVQEWSDWLLRFTDEGNQVWDDIAANPPAPANQAIPDQAPALQPDDANDNENQPEPDLEEAGPIPEPPENQDPSEQPSHSVWLRQIDQRWNQWRQVPWSEAGPSRVPQYLRAGPGPSQEVSQTDRMADQQDDSDDEDSD